MPTNTESAMFISRGSNFEIFASVYPRNYPLLDLTRESRVVRSSLRVPVVSSCRLGGKKIEGSRWGKDSQQEDCRQQSVYPKSDRH